MDFSLHLSTPRLTLRAATLADADAVAACWNLDETPISRADAEEKIRRMAENHALMRPGKLRHLCLAVICKADNAFIGWCGLDHTNPGDADPALFYLLKAAYWGKGLATEAAGALLDFAFTQLELTSVHGGCAPDNLASKCVMEKIGMRYVGIDDEGGFAFTLSRDDYFADRRR